MPTARCPNSAIRFGPVSRRFQGVEMGLAAVRHGQVSLFTVLRWPHYDLDTDLDAIGILRDRPGLPVPFQAFRGVGEVLDPGQVEGTLPGVMD